jgi:hypothetical protein
MWRGQGSRRPDEFSKLAPEGSVGIGWPDPRDDDPLAINGVSDLYLRLDQHLVRTGQSGGNGTAIKVWIKV